MSDQPDAGSLPELTPEQEAAVTRLLAEARHGSAVPADVAARLDEALAELSHADLDGVAPAHEPQVVDLAAHRRRRRNAGRLLLAAAAVIVVGVGIGQIIGNGTDGSDDSTAATSGSLDRSASQSAGADADTQSRSDSGAESDSSGSLQQPALPAPLASLDVPLVLTGSDPDQLAQQLLNELAGVSADLEQRLADPVAPEEQLDSLQAVPGFVCPSPTSGSYGAGELLPAFYDGRAVVLALRPSAEGGDGTTQADVLECGTGAAVTTFTVTLS